MDKSKFRVMPITQTIGNMVLMVNKNKKVTQVICCLNGSPNHWSVSEFWINNERVLANIADYNLYKHYQPYWLQIGDRVILDTDLSEMVLYEEFRIFKIISTEFFKDRVDFCRFRLVPVVGSGHPFTLSYLELQKGAVLIDEDYGKN